MNILSQLHSTLMKITDNLLNHKNLHFFSHLFIHSIRIRLGMHQFYILAVLKHTVTVQKKDYTENNSDLKRMLTKANVFVEGRITLSKLPNLPNILASSPSEES